MTSKERVMAIFAHQVPDRIPMWCGASPEFMKKARGYLNCKNDEEVLIHFHDDFRRVYSRYVGPDEFNPEYIGNDGKVLSIFGIEREGIGYGQAISHPLADAAVDEISGRVDVPLTGHTPHRIRTCGFPASGSLQN